MQNVNSIARNIAKIFVIKLFFKGINSPSVILFFCVNDPVHMRFRTVHRVVSCKNQHAKTNIANKSRKEALMLKREFNPKTCGAGAPSDANVINPDSTVAIPVRIVKIPIMTRLRFI